MVKLIYDDVIKPVRGEPAQLGSERLNTGENDPGTWLLLTAIVKAEVGVWLHLAEHI